MPNRDGTGSHGKGSKTGRQLGTCEGAEPVGQGRGSCGCGKRRGFGRRHGRFCSSPEEGENSAERSGDSG